MLKLSQILNEEVESVKLNRFEKRTLLYMCQEKVNPINIRDVYEFLEEQLFMKNEEEIVKIIKLYKHNFSYENVESGECEKIGESIDLPKNEDYDEEKIVLGIYLDIDPYLIETLTHHTILDEYENLIDGDEYLVGTYQQAVDAAKQRIWGIIDTEGYSYSDEDWLSYYVEIDDQSAKYNAEERAKDDTLHYDEEQLREMIYVDDEYESLSDDREYEKEERKEKISEYKIIKFKLEKLEKEKKIIEREIETLGYSLDYDYDDDGDYNEMYDIDIGEMSDSLNELDTIIYENLSYVNQLESEIGVIEKSIEDINKSMSKLEGEELIDLAIENLSENYMQDYSDDPMSYIESSGYTIEEAENEGMITIDEEHVVTDYLNREGMGGILSSYNGDISEIKFKGETYYIFRN